MISKPNIYVDTNICRDCIKRRKLDSIHLMGTISDKKWRCITSVFTLMELFDIEKDDLFAHKKIRQGYEINKIIRERYDKELNADELEEIKNQIEAFLATYKNIEIKTLDESGWNRAFWISAYSNLTAVDVIHLSVAHQSDCDVLVTSDKKFIREGSKLLESNNIKNMKICDVPNVRDVLKSLKFKNVD